MVLALKAARGIDDKDADVGIFDRTNRSHHRIKLKILFHFCLAADACGIDEVELESEPVELGVDGIARRPGDVGYDITVLSDERIDETRFPGIRATDDSKPRQSLFRLLLLWPFRESSNQCIEQFACSTSRHTRKSVVISQAKVVKFDSIFLAHGIVDLIDGKQHRLGDFPQQFGYFLIHRGDAFFHVDHKNDHVCLVDGKFYLFANLSLEDIV